MIQENPAERPKFARSLPNLTRCFGDFADFEQKIQQIAAIAGVDLRQLEIDHLAVRMNETATAEQWRAMLLEHAELLKESEVNGRPIGLFKLFEPLNFLGQSVSMIELPFPKGKTYAVEGWEHIEAVVPFLPDESVEQWTERVCKGFDLANNLQIKLKISQPVVAGERLPNPSIAISLKDATNQNYCCLKLHPYDINTIVRSELML